MPLFSGVHLDRLQQLLAPPNAPAVAVPRRWRRQPSPRQCLEQDIRAEAVDCYKALRARGQAPAECSRLLRLPLRTLRFWESARRAATIALAPVGRPAVRAPLAVRQALLAHLRLTGPGIGVPSLAAAFPDVPRRELADFVARYRAVCRPRHRAWQRVLHWQTPGRVWAADFTLAAGAPWPGVLAVRDLASGLMLAWQPLPAMTEAVTAAALAALFTRYGAPLVLKMDNGSAFRAALLQGSLEQSGVIPLYAPPACPGYNGAIEAAIGSLKKRTEDEARRHGGCRWEPADLAAARAAANAGHPRRLNGRTPTAVWDARTPAAPLERVVFTLTVERERFRVRTELGIDPDEPLDHWRQSAVDRQAIERALVEHGYLLFTRRRLPLTIQRRKVTADG
jgi:transposase InsO family protein